MTFTIRRTTRLVALAVSLAGAGACSNANLGDILGGVLGGTANGTAVEGTIRGVNANNQQISLQQTNGESVAIGYDQNTVVLYQNQRYAVGNLEYGDQVVARVLNNNGSYYTDSIRVTQPVNGSTTGGTASGSVQSFQGRVGTIDRQNGTFVVSMTNGSLTVSLPYNVGSGDLQRFQSLRTGDTARFYGVLLNNSRVELRQFY